MIRPLHRWAGLAAALVVTVVALSGAVLSAYPLVEAMLAPQTPAISVGEFAARAAANVPGIEQIRRAPSGSITAYAYDANSALELLLDPATGEARGAAEPSASERFFTNLHRALFLGDGGRLTVIAASLAMLALIVSGYLLAARRLGGWRQLLAPVRAKGGTRLHVEVARISGAVLCLSALTGLWMGAATFNLLPQGAGPPAFPAGVSGESGISPAAMPALQDVPLTDLRELTFPRQGNLRDVFTLKTASGEGYVDQGTGALLAWGASGPIERITDTVHMLHTGRGAALVGLIFGLAALAVPLLSATGLLEQAKRGSPRAHRTSSAPAETADTILLVGSEGGTSWGFAESLRAGLSAAGSSVHVGAMSDFSPERYGRASRAILLAATTGDGTVPASARGFLEKLSALPEPPAMPVAVLGFGDRAFSAFCGYARAVEAAISVKGWKRLMPLATVDRQSERDFASFGEALGEKLGVHIALHHRPIEAEAVPLTLLSRRDYGAEVQAPTAILRFARPRASLWQRLTGKGFAGFQAGDLLGIVPEGDRRPRYYSLASSWRDGFAEICVRKHPGGLCSGQLTELLPGQKVHAFLRRNPGFHPAPGREPLILIGAGTGIGPLAGFARANGARRAMHLYFGARDAASDLLYGEELAGWKEEGRLASLTTAFSRTSRAYVQDALRQDRARLEALIGEGARIMVCGGRDMAAGVSGVLGEILAPLGENVAAMKSAGRYVEDVY